MKTVSLRTSSGVAAAVLIASAVAAWAQMPRDFAAPLQEEKKIPHALNRLAFGPRPTDVETVRRAGLHRWIEAQLQPEKLDDRRVQQKLSVLKTLHMEPEKLLLAHLADTGNVMRRARQMQQQERQRKAGKPVQGEVVKLNTRQMETLKRIQASGLPPQTSVQAIGELQLEKTVRAVESERQLYEVLVDFWSNHFNQDVKKNNVRALKIVDEREVIRPHVLGKFRDLLGASAKSPSMLVYLDNATSSRVMEAPVRRGAKAQATPPRRRGGINENYARELMELHSLGVDGGYTQQDVQEVARCFTGWTLDRTTGKFLFRARAHDDGEKIVLGQRIPAGGGIRDGERVLDILATHPSTAKYLAHKLCVRFIADEPPTSAVAKAAKIFRDSGGDLRAVVRTIVTSPEFFSTGAYRAKIKSPFEYSVSAVRALGGTVLMPDPQLPTERLRLVADGAASVRPGRRYRPAQKTLAMHIAEMGQPLYSYQAPTGYSEDSREWVSTGALVARLNYALALVGSDVSDVVATPTLLLKDVDEHDREAIMNRLLERLVAGDVAAGTRSTLQRETAGEGVVDRMKLAALILGSPEFQRR